MFTKPSKLERYRELELIPADLYPTPTKTRRSWLVLRAIGRWIADVTTPSTEPRIYRGTDDDGALYWRVCDPITGESARFYNEAEVRTWLDDRYHRRSRTATSLPDSSIHRYSDRLWH